MRQDRMTQIQQSHLGIAWLPPGRTERGFKSVACRLRQSLKSQNEGEFQNFSKFAGPVSKLGLQFVIPPTLHYDCQKLLLKVRGS
jgi:hypothetical protein